METGTQTEQAKQLSEEELQAQARRVMLVQRRDKINQALTNSIEMIQNSLPRGMDAKKLIQVAVNCCSRNPKLLTCTTNSVLGCVITAAQLGLMPDSFTGEAHLIPFEKRQGSGVFEAQFIPGYRGLIQLALRSGQVSTFQAWAVYKGDEFDYALGTERFIKHKPTGEGDEITHFYAVLEMRNGGKLFDVLTVKEVNRIRDKAANYKFARDKAKTVWAQYYEEMGKKTVIRRLAKYAPISPEFQKAVALDEEVEILGRSQNSSAEIYDTLKLDDKAQTLDNFSQVDIAEEVDDNDMRNEGKAKAEKGIKAVKNMMGGNTEQT